MNLNIKILTAQGPSTGAQYISMHNMAYYEAVKALMYMMLGTHLDISFAMTIISNIFSNPSMVHWEAIKCVH